MQNKIILSYLSSTERLKTTRRFTIRNIGVTSKTLRTVVMASSAYIGCWFSHIVLIIIQYWCPQVLVAFANQSPRLYEGVTIVASDVLPTLNSCINPFIYFIFSDVFRKALTDLKRKLLKQRRCKVSYVCSPGHNELLANLRLGCSESRVSSISASQRNFFSHHLQTGTETCSTDVQSSHSVYCTHLTCPSPTPPKKENNSHQSVPYTHLSSSTTKKEICHSVRIYAKRKSKPRKYGISYLDENRPIVTVQSTKL